MFFVIKGHFAIQIVESIWLHRITCMQEAKVMFLTKKMFTEKILLPLVQKTLVEYVQLTLATCVLATCTFELYVQQGG